MRIASITVLLLVSIAHVAAAMAVNPATWTRVRPMTQSAAALLDYATERSSIVRAMLQRLERTDVIVYLVDSMSGAADEPAAYLGFLSHARGTRYLFIRVARWGVEPAERVAWLGHELQHALEIAADPRVQDAAGLARLYRSIGWEWEAGRFESDGARAAGKQIRSQLAASDAPR